MKSVVISIVRDDGYAAQIGLRAQDVIYRIDGNLVESPQSVTDRLAKGAAKFSVIRGDEMLHINIDSTSLGVLLNEIDFDEAGWLERQAVSSVLLTTAQTFSEKRITKTLDVVGAQCVYGVNAIADLTAGFREFVGGRSQVLQRKIAEAREQVCRELRSEAHVRGGNGVVAVSFSFSEIGDKGGYMLMVVGTGTAVVVE